MEINEKSIDNRQAYDELIRALEIVSKGLPAPYLPPVNDPKLNSISRLVTEVSEKNQTAFENLRSVNRSLRTEKERLEDKVEILEGELEQAVDSAKVGERMKEEFIANINHKLRTPLTSIIGFTSLLLQDKEGMMDTRKIAEYLGIVLQEGERLMGMVETMINLARINSGESPPAFKLFGLNKRITTESPKWSNDLPKDVALYLDLDESVGSIVADPGMILTAIGMLISNASACSPAGSVITVTTCNMGDNVVIEVIDQGEGLPGEALDSIFQNFTQHNKPDGSGGLGVGLSLVRSIAWLHKGEVSVTSEEGVGSRFKVTIPYNPDAAYDALTTSSNMERSLALVADDDMNSRLLLKGMLKEKFDIVEAADGHEAVRMCAKHKPAILLADMAMPEKDGIATILEIRSNPEICDTPILVLSAKTSPKVVEAAYSAGANSYLSKPFTKEELLRDIYAILGVKQT